MIDQVTLNDYITCGPQGELLRTLKNGQSMLDYKIKLSIDDDPRWIRLEATRPGAPTFVQLISVACITCITIGADEAPVKKLGRPNGKEA